jgi:hypothetical protein
VQTDLLDRVRKLLAKAEDEGCTPAEAEALTAKAAELMARYGIDRALLGALRPETDSVGDRVFELDNPWAAVKAHLLAGLAAALRCQCILLNRREPGSRVHVFGFLSDLERADILFTSLLVQMARALAAQPIPGYGGGAKAWRRSWMLGYASAVVARVRAAEEAAVVASAASAEDTAASGGASAEIVLADRALTVRLQAEQAYPRTRRTRVTYTGNGYADGYREGQKADIGGAKLRSRPSGALSR